MSPPLKYFLQSCRSPPVPGSVFQMASMPLRKSTGLVLSAAVVMSTGASFHRCHDSLTTSCYVSAHPSRLFLVLISLPLVAHPHRTAGITITISKQEQQWSKLKQRNPYAECCQTALRSQAAWTRPVKHRGSQDGRRNCQKPHERSEDL